MATDYKTFPRATITFPAGSADGTTQSISLEFLDDSQFEADETIELRLANAVGPAVLGLNATHTVTIADDDVESPQKLYWLDAGQVDRLQRADINGKGVKDLFVGAGLKIAGSGRGCSQR